MRGLPSHRRSRRKPADIPGGGDNRRTFSATANNAAAAMRRALAALNGASVSIKLATTYPKSR
jgi:hypothetical protein